jgi:sarcosine oxidase
VEYDAEVAVVGGGVMGLATTRALAQAGRDVVLLEQFAIGHDRGSSHGGSRIFRLTYPEAEWVRLAQESLPLWSELESEWGAPLREWHGSLDLGDWAADRDALAACGAPFEILEAKEVERRFPVRLEAGERALFQPDAGIVLADQAQRALRSGAEAAGARVLERTHVPSIEEGADSVRVAGLRVRAVVVTAGAWADRLVELDTTPTRETVAYFSFSEPFPSMIDRAEGDTFGRLGYALVAPGIGAKAGSHHSGPVTDPAEAGTPDAGIVTGIAEWAPGRLRGLQPEPVHVETCLYTNRPGERFVLERRGRVVVGSACSGHGFKFAPLIGGRLAALATEVL